jgi:hypothetical protein
VCFFLMLFASFSAARVRSATGLTTQPRWGLSVVLLDLVKESRMSVLIQCDGRSYILARSPSSTFDPSSRRYGLLVGQALIQFNDPSMICCRLVMSSYFRSLLHPCGLPRESVFWIGFPSPDSTLSACFVLRWPYGIIYRSDFLLSLSWRQQLWNLQYRYKDMS